MARKRQKLVNYHTSGTTLPSSQDLYLGEIAVQHNDDNPLLIIKKTNGELATFWDSVKVQTEISNITGNVETLTGVSENPAYIGVTGETDGATGVVTVNVVVAEVSADTVGLADAKDVKGYVDEQIGDVHDYVDEKVSSVYRAKGTVQTYNDLPTGATEGDVYDIAEECTVSGKTYPAGTNFVWVEGEGGADGHWDALAGTMSGYQTIDAFTAWTSTTYATKQAAQDEAITSTDTKANSAITKADNAIKDAAYDSTLNSDTTGVIIETNTNAYFLVDGTGDTKTLKFNFSDFSVDCGDYGY